MNDENEDQRFRDAFTRSGSGTDPELREPLNLAPSTRRIRVIMQLVFGLASMLILIYILWRFFSPNSVPEWLADVPLSMVFSLVPLLMVLYLLLMAIRAITRAVRSLSSEEQSGQDWKVQDVDRPYWD